MRYNESNVMHKAILNGLFSATLMAGASSAYANDANISCGAASKGGTLTVEISLTGPDGKAIKPPVTWDVVIDKGDSGELKAQKIRAAAPQNSPYVTVGGTSNAVTGSSKPGYKITGMDFTNDKTGETSAPNVFTAAVQPDGLFSLEGFAAGVTDDDLPSTVSIGVGSSIALVPLAPGMPAEFLEDILIAQLVMQGIEARLAVPADQLAERYGDSFEGDGRVIVLPNLPLGFWADSNDRDLDVDIVGLVDSGADIAIGTGYCPANANSTGEAADIHAYGSVHVELQELRLVATQLPTHQFGYFITARNAGFSPFAGGSQGNLCLGSGTGRFVAQTQPSGALGRIEIEVDMAALPTNPVSPILAGERWHFQCWYRDVNPMTTSNFTDAVWIDFE